MRFKKRPSGEQTSPGPWDAFADVEVSVDEVLAELKAVAKMVSDRCDRGQPPRATEGSVGLDLIRAFGAWRVFPLIDDVGTVQRSSRRNRFDTYSKR